MFSPVFAGCSLRLWVGQGTRVPPAVFSSRALASRRNHGPCGCRPSVGRHGAEARRRLGPGIKDAPSTSRGRVVDGGGDSGTHR